MYAPIMDQHFINTACLYYKPTERERERKLKFKCRNPDDKMSGWEMIVLVKVLQCVILHNGQPMDLVWRKNQMLIATKILKNHHLQYNSDYNANTDIVITYVTLEDDNLAYECTAENNNITSSLVLNVTGQ